MRRIRGLIGLPALDFAIAHPMTRQGMKKRTMADNRNPLDFMVVQPFAEGFDARLEPIDRFGREGARGIRNMVPPDGGQVIKVEMGEVGLQFVRRPPNIATALEPFAVTAGDVKRKGAMREDGLSRLDGTGQRRCDDQINRLIGQ